MATTTPRKTPRKPAARKAPVKVVDLVPDSDAVELFTTPDADRPVVPKVVLFSIDGKQYLVDSKYPPGLGLKVIRTALRHGEELAMAELLAEILDDEAYEALINYKDLKPEHMMLIIQRVRDLAMGAVQGPKDSSASA